jgi:aspartyl-tRNA(Asn)/glutamyl-tRNA(Gln) amidotransferase subunit B
VEFEAVIGLEVHAELATRSKMFCSCPVVDNTQAEANVAVCPVCAGMPGVLPVVNRQAVEMGMKVAAALQCTIAKTSLFDRKNYFYPDLPKGYQISQFEFPLAQKGLLWIDGPNGPATVRVRRVHLEEDTGKLTHVTRDGESFSLVDLNRAGVPLLEMVSEPDMHTVEEVRSYVTELRAILRCLEVNSGDMEKGVIRFEANISIRRVGSDVLNNRVEIKNLNSFRALERSITFEIARQTRVVEAGGTVVQETVGWDESNNSTFSQRSKEDAHDYRYFPEPDLPPLVVEKEWIDRIITSQPELPRPRTARLQTQYGLNAYDANLLIAEKTSADYFEKTAALANGVSGKVVANWIMGELFAWVKQSGQSLADARVQPPQLAELLILLEKKEITQNSAKAVLQEMLETGKTAGQIVKEKNLGVVSNSDEMARVLDAILADNPAEVQNYLNGKETVSQWFFGQAMRQAKGQFNPQMLRSELENRLENLKKASDSNKKSDI